MFLKFLSQYEISTLNIKFQFPIVWKCKPNPNFESEFPCINIADKGGSGGATSLKNKMSPHIWYLGGS